jgi:nicotinamide phosphoribosyltransferase
MNKNMMLMMDFYKVSHRCMYPNGLSKLYYTWTPRSNKFFKESKFVVWFGLQGLIITYLINYFNKWFFSRPLEEVLEEYKLYIHNTFDENAHTEHIEALHKLGYLPIEIKALPEGTKVPYRVPCCIVTNTHPDFAWVANYFETLFSCNLWMPSTTATRAYIFRKIIEKYIKLTSDNKDWKRVGCGDFSFRGMAGLEAAITSGAAFLTSFTKTSTIPSIKYLCDCYGYAYSVYSEDKSRTGDARSIGR